MATESIDISKALLDKINLLRGDMSIDEYLEKILAKAEKLPISSFGQLDKDELNFDQIKQARRDKEVVI